MNYPTFEEETSLWEAGFRFIVGLDEVGRGAWAGPVVAAAVVFAPQQDLPKGINDSKKLSPKKRAELEPLIKKTAIAWAWGEVGVETITQLGISAATQLAMKQAVSKLAITPDFYLIDYIKLRDFSLHPQKAIPKGDALSLTIAAASILAKVHRDQLMINLHQEDSRYCFHQHKGYGTKLHRECLVNYGPSPHHRPTFIPNPLIP